MTMSDGTLLSQSGARSLSASRESTSRESKSRESSSLPLVISLSFAGLLVLALGAGLLAWQRGWLRAPLSPVAIVPIEWPSDPVITGSSRRSLSSHGLSPAPDPRLIEIIPEGVLPVRAEDGATPLSTYARPLSPEAGMDSTTPRVALILRGVGIGQLATLEASLRLSPDISFAVSPYAREIDRQADEIREEGHELFLDLPIMARDHSVEDTGPEALIPTISEGENLVRLKWSMARVAGYAGLLAVSGSEGTVGPEVKDLLARQSNARGLGLIVHTPPVSAASSTKAGEAFVDVLIARDVSPLAFDAALDRLNEAAKRNGSAVGVAVITPLAIERLRKWSESLSAKGVRLVPASSVIARAG